MQRLHPALILCLLWASVVSSAFAQPATFTHDANGNLTRWVDGPKTTVFAYNRDNQLSYYREGSTAMAFSYDGLGNRITKSSRGTFTRYVVDPADPLSRVLAESDGKGAIQRYYVYGLGLVSQIVGDQAYYYQYDGLGSTVGMTDQDGTVVNRYAYGAFGQLATNSVETVPNAFKYVGRYGVMTDAPDLVSMRARYYVPSLGRFASHDPLGFLGGDLNLYAYVGNDPVNLIDPSGLLAWPYTWQGWVGIILTSAGGLTTLVPIPGAVPLGLRMVVVGVGFTIWDIIEGANKASEIGTNTGKKVTDFRDLYNEEWQELGGTCSMRRR